MVDAGAFLTVPQAQQLTRLSVKAPYASSTALWSALAALTQLRHFHLVMYTGVCSHASL